MKISELSQGPEKRDYWVALILTMVALAAYVRTLAPDVLYGDSAEFQTLAYTFGITHSTGYPTYLLLGRLLGFLPSHSLAWRISLLSAVNAAIAVGGIYLLTRYFTRSRAGAVLGAVALGVSYTFWSQAVIAEVYTSGLAFIVVITLLLFHWQGEPKTRNRFLLTAALLAGIGFGVHASVWLLAPPAVALVLWTLWWRHASRTEWLRSLAAGFVGAVIGLTVFMITFFISDWLNPPTSFIRATLEPSRVFWNLPLSDFDSPLKVLKMTVISAQWGDAEFTSHSSSFTQDLQSFIGRLLGIEFSPPVILLALAGAVVILVRQPRRGLFHPLAFLVSLIFILNYQVDDKNVFYLSLYIPLAVAAGTGFGFVLEWVQRYLQSMSERSYQLLNLLPMLFFATMVIQPVAAIRWQALKAGVADFVTEDYQFPVKSLAEPRFVAEMRLAGVDPNAVFVLDWRDLYSTAYIAQVERGLIHTLFFEGMPRGNDGYMASTLVAQLEGYLKDGRPVFTEKIYPGLEQKFRPLPVAGNLYKLMLRK